jgi:hypothetical protein
MKGSVPSSARWILCKRMRRKGVRLATIAEPSSGLEPETPPYHRATRREARAKPGSRVHESAQEEGIEQSRVTDGTRTPNTAPRRAEAATRLGAVHG